MKAEEIMRVLHLTAMGRVNAPEQKAFCEALESVLERHSQAVEAVPSADSWIKFERLVSEPVEPVQTHAIEIAPAKRGPGRSKKAE